jgi:hypothetical protein
MIRAGRDTEVTKNSGFWIFVDMGFSRDKPTCGFLLHDKEPMEITFSVLCEKVVEQVRSSKEPVNLLLEAPLSVAFNEAGNPTGRTVEKMAGFGPRYWYLGLGCCVLTAATYLLRGLVNCCPEAEIRLFEGFVSFKEKGKKSSHKDDVLALRSAAWNLSASAVVKPQGFSETDRIGSAFLVAGMDFGIPPIITANS